MPQKKLTYIPDLDTYLDLTTITGVNVYHKIDDYNEEGWAVQVVHTSGEVRLWRSYKSQDIADDVAKTVVDLINEQPDYD